MAFLTVPAAVGFVVFGFLLVGALFRRGSFGLVDNWLVYLVLVAYTLGMLASATSRLLNNVFYAHSQTRRPARIAMERVLISAAIGVVLMLWLDRWSVNQILGLDDAEPALFLGAVGLALGAGVASWYELGRLARTLGRDFGGLSLPWRYTRGLLGIALASAVPGILVWRGLRSLPPLLLAPLTLAVFAAVYLWLTRRLGVVTLGLWLGSRRQRGDQSGGEEGR